MQVGSGEEEAGKPANRRGLGVLIAALGLSVAACGSIGQGSAPAAAGTRTVAADPGATSASSVAISRPTTSPTSTPAAPASFRPPHFDTPQAAMTYLASAWNANDPVELGHVTDPSARSALQAMRSDAVNLRLNHCQARPQGDYLCFFDHDFVAGHPTSVPGAGGHAVFVVGPADTPGWYMTVFESCD